MGLVTVSLHIDSEPEGKKQQTRGSRDCSYIVWLCHQKWRKRKKEKKEAEKQNPRQKAGGDTGQLQLSASQLCSTSFWLSRKAKKSKNRAVSAWKQPRGNVLNNWPVGQLWRALMCETPIKRFAWMATKHFTFKYRSKFVLHNGINITKVGWRMRFGNQPILRKPTQTLQRMQSFAQAFVLLTSCWHKLIKTEKSMRHSGWDIVCPCGNKVHCLPENSLLVMYTAFPGRWWSCLILFHGGCDSLEKCTTSQEVFYLFSVAISSWDRSEGKSP